MIQIIAHAKSRRKVQDLVDSQLISLPLPRLRHRRITLKSLTMKNQLS